MEASTDFKPYKDYIRQSVKGWESLSDDDIELLKFQSLSNSVYKVTSKQNVEPSIIVFRVFQTTFYGQPKAQFGFIPQENKLKI